jgi:DNA processing protein
VERHNPTIAVLGSGLDRPSIYPPENLNLATRIVETGGALISEFSPGAEPFPQHFPQRNRIVSGLALGVIVIEAPFESGALITAKFALEQGKEVFAVPGPINAKNSEGTNMLIKNGAHPVTCAEDVLEILQIENKKPKNKKTEEQNFSSDERKILEALSQEPLHIDKIIESTGLSTQTVNAILTVLEMKDLIKHIGNNVYALVNV